jgi:hypothetical protein
MNQYYRNIQKISNHWLEIYSRSEVHRAKTMQVTNNRKFRLTLAFFPKQQRKTTLQEVAWEELGSSPHESLIALFSTLDEKDARLGMQSVKSML